MLLQQVCPGKTSASLQSIHSISFGLLRYIVYGASDSVVICDASFKPIQILYIQKDSKEHMNQQVASVVMSEFDAKIAVTTHSHVLIYRPTETNSKITHWRFHSSLEINDITSLSWRNDGHLITGGDHLTLWQPNGDSWIKIWEQRQGSRVDHVQFSPDGKLFASMAKNDPLVKVWSLEQAQTSEMIYKFFYLKHPRAVSNFSWRKDQLKSDDPNHVNILFTMSRDGICRIWSPLIHGQAESMSACAVIDPNQWLVSQQQSTPSPVQYPIHALDGMELAMAVEFAASKTLEMNDVNSIRLQKLKELVKDTADLFFQIQGDGSMIIWGVQNLGRTPKRIPRVLLVLRVSSAVTPLEAPYFMRNIISYHDTTMTRSRGTSPADVVIMGQSLDGRVSCFSVNMMELFDSGNILTGLSLRQCWTGQESRIKAIVKDHRQLCFTSVGDLGDTSLWKLKTPRFGHRVAAGLVEVGSLPSGVRDIQLVTPAWEGGSFMAYDGQRITLYTADEHTDCTAILDLPDYDPAYPLTLLDCFEIPFLITVEGSLGKTTDVAWRRYVIGFSTTDNMVFTWKRGPDDAADAAPVLMCKERLPKSVTKFAVTVESFAGTLPKSLHSTHTTVFATYSEQDANISYWQCANNIHEVATDKRSIWQRAERIPTRPGLETFQCGANGKLAIVYGPNGVASPLIGQGHKGENGNTLEIWGSVGGRAKGRLESRLENLDEIVDLDWMVTADARHNLAVAFKTTVSMFSPQRTESVTDAPQWKRFMDINLPSFIHHPISAIAWLDMGTLSIGAGGTMLLYGKWLSEEYSTIAPGFDELRQMPTIHHALVSMFGPLPDYHPDLLQEFFIWGKFQVVRKVLFNLYHYVKYVNETQDKTTGGPLPIPLEVILNMEDIAAAGTDKTSLINGGAANNYGDLFAMGDDSANAGGTSSDLEDESKFLNDKTSAEMIDFLTRVQLAGLSKSAQLRLTALIEGFSQIEKHHGAVDENGLRFLMFVRRFNYLSVLLSPMQRPQGLHSRDITWAYYSESQDLLVQTCTASLKNPMVWTDAKALGLPIWLRKKEALVKQMEILARNLYMGKDDVKDPVAASLFYLALRKKKLLHGLWRTAHAHPEQSKMVIFLANDFDQPRWKTAALKNAFALLGKQRFAYAAAFFLLADKLQDAVNVCVKNMDDVALAIAICRVYEDWQGQGDTPGPVLQKLLRDQIESSKDSWLKIVYHSMLGQPREAILSSLQPEDCEPEDLDMPAKATNLAFYGHEHRDPSLLILYKHLLKKYPAVSAVKTDLVAGDEEFLAVERAAEAYEHYGCPMLSLVILKHWGYVLPVGGEVTKEISLMNGSEIPAIDASPAAIAAANGSFVRRNSLSSPPPSSLSFMGGFKKPVSSGNDPMMDSGILDFGFGSGSAKKDSSTTTSPQKSPAAGRIGGFKQFMAEEDSESEDGFGFGGGFGRKKSNNTAATNGDDSTVPKTSMSMMGGFKTVSSEPAEFDDSSFGFGGFGGGFGKKKVQQETPSEPAEFDDSSFGFGGFGGGFGKKKEQSVTFDSSTEENIRPLTRKKTFDIFAEFAPPPELETGTLSFGNGNGHHGGKEKREGSEDSTNSSILSTDSVDPIRGTEELLNDYITTLVVQLLTPMASALRTVSLRPELLARSGFKGYVETIKIGWDKLSEHANVSNVVMEQALITKCIEIDTLPVCFHWLNTTMSTGSPLSAIVAHYSESCYSMVGIVLTEEMTACMKTNLKEYARSVLESSNEWFNLAKTVIAMDKVLPRWEQMVLASYIMLVAMALQEQDYVTLAGMLFQWRRFSGFVMGDRGGAVKVINEVLNGKLYSPLDPKAIHGLNEGLQSSSSAARASASINGYRYDEAEVKTDRELLQEKLLDAATTNALAMGLEGLLRDHGHRMSDETRKFITSSFLDRLTRSGIDMERHIIRLLEKVQASAEGAHGGTLEPLRSYLNSWQKKYWILLNGLESGGHLLPLVSAYMERKSKKLAKQARWKADAAAAKSAENNGYLNPASIASAAPSIMEDDKDRDVTLLYKTGSVVTSFSFSPVDHRIVAICSKSNIVEIDISKSIPLQKSNSDALAHHHGASDMESDMDEDDEDREDDDDDDGSTVTMTLDGGAHQKRSSRSSRASSIVPDSAAAAALPRPASQASFQSVFKNLFSSSRTSTKSTNSLVEHGAGFPHAQQTHHHTGLGGLSNMTLAASHDASKSGGNTTENLVVRADMIATCSESHPTFPLYITGHNPSLGYQSVMLWQYGQPKELNYYSGTSSKVTKVHFDAFGQKFGATDGAGDMHLWRFDSNTTGAKPFRSWNSHSKIARDFAFLGSSSVIATTGSSTDGRNLAIWDTLLPKEKALTHSFYVHGSGGYVASGGGGAGANGTSGLGVSMGGGSGSGGGDDGTGQGHRSGTAGGGGYSLAFSARHQILASGGRQGEICLFDIRQPCKLLYTIQAHEMHVRSLFMDDCNGSNIGHRRHHDVLCSGSGEGDMKVWRLDTFEQVDWIESLQARNRFKLQTFDRIPVKAYGVAQIETFQQQDRRGGGNGGSGGGDEAGGNGQEDDDEDEEDREADAALGQMSVYYTCGPTGFQRVRRRHKWV